MPWSIVTNIATRMRTVKLITSKKLIQLVK